MLGASLHLGMGDNSSDSLSFSGEDHVPASFLPKVLFSGDTLGIGCSAVARVWGAVHWFEFV